jgi:FAD:protein FMN transferase
MMRTVGHHMGMPWTLDVRDGGDPDPAAVEEVFAELERIDACFSPFRPESTIRRLARGELAESDAGPEVRAVLDQCRRYERATGGYFTAWPGGRLDPCGLVKGWAIDRACEILDRHGHRNYAVDAGGDVQTRGHRGDGSSWRIGIRHPVDRAAVVRVVSARDMAVATSGTYERGAHIHDPLTGASATALLSLTVVGADIVEADVHATAAFAMGPGALPFIESVSGLEAYAIDHDLRGTWTSGFDELCQA